jgi:PBP1b-binding outer membrane lipoprotein LpoB
MRINYLLCLTALILAGCASAPNEEVKAEAPKRICAQEYQTGSNLPMKHCKAPASAAERQRNIDEIRDGLDALSVKPIGSGG